MASASIIRFLNPRKYRRDRDAERVRALRLRDGDHCARCRRPLRFDLPAGHDQGPAIEPKAAGDSLDGAHLCHRRCSTAGVDHTDEVTERVRRKSEAALFAKARKKRRAA
jgi:hypothetical protein